ncbi:MAG TPA: succinyl-CoA--3-ketoacid-CoA transferase, partial [Candidatus Cloacimonas sp.]|nr:succinyl-CoA--3-ketoacid-CoA transferase [Candidatus Cloacimonas sp.]
LKEVAAWTNLEEVKQATEADLIVADNVGTFE